MWYICIRFNQKLGEGKMEDIIDESDVFLLENTLLILIRNIYDFRGHIACIASSSGITPIDLKQYEELKKEFYEGLLNSFNEVKKFKRFHINKNWYTKENISEDNISWEILLNEIFCLEIRATYNILQLNMRKLKVAAEKVNLNKNNITIKKREIRTYFDCDHFLGIIFDLLLDFPEEVTEALDENMIERCSLVLNEFFSKNKKNIKGMLSVFPDPFLLDDPYALHSA